MQAQENNHKKKIKIKSQVSHNLARPRTKETKLSIINHNSPKIFVLLIVLIQF